MEHWHSAGILPGPADRKDNPPSRVLTVSSGNVQSYAQDSREGVENYNPHPNTFPTNSTPKYTITPRYPAPTSTLASNDQRDANAARLHHRRRQKIKQLHNGIPDPRRTYLQHEKYLNYRCRQRLDIGKDGRPVWDDVTEEAFQNALFHIKPMGRSKMAQNGKANGRNELIAEWILHETGVSRSRKQVSSHIQVLKKLMKDHPVWQALIVAPPGAKIVRQPSDYYSNSIQHKVQCMKHERSSHSRGQPLSTRTLGPDMGCSDKHHITGLSFDMWVSPGTDMTQILHNYTRLQSNNSASAGKPLENIENWRNFYPDLSTILGSWKLSEKCDIILLEAGIELMSDFPERGSKLGINLEVNFLHPSNGNIKALQEMREWSYKTSLYESGCKRKETLYKNCHLAGIGTVKPVFESKWWANQFTWLTENHREAADSRDEAQMQAARSLSSNYLNHLTVMQEIWSHPRPHQPDGIWSDPVGAPQRMAILLWKFSEVRAPSVGTTAWRRLIPPPDRTTTNSPPSKSDELVLPPLSMSGMVDMVTDDQMYIGTYDTLCEHDPPNTIPLYAHDMDGGLYSNGLGPSQEKEVAGLEASFDMTTLHDGPHGLDLHDMNPFHFDMGQQEVDFLQHDTSDRGFEPHHHQQQQTQFEKDEHGDSQRSQIHMIPEQESTVESERQPLMTFDVNTHNLLQAQIGQVSGGACEGPEEEALRAALVAASTTGDVECRMSANFAPQSPFEWIAPLPRRILSKDCTRYITQQGQDEEDDAAYGHVHVYNHEVDNMTAFVPNSYVAASAAHPMQKPDHHTQLTECEREHISQTVSLLQNGPGLLVGEASTESTNGSERRMSRRGGGGGSSSAWNMDVVDIDQELRG